MKQFLIALDQLINTLMGGYADESISARSYRLRNKGWSLQYKLINKLFFWQKDHCKASFISEIKRRQLPVEYRQDRFGEFFKREGKV